MSFRSRHRPLHPFPYTHLPPPPPPRTGSLSNGAAADSASKSEDLGDGKTPPTSTNEDETADAGAERLQAVEALCSLARSFGGGGGGGGSKGDARSAAIAAAAGGGAEAQCKRLTKTAQFLLEVGFFAPADGGKWS